MNDKKFNEAHKRFLSRRRCRALIHAANSKRRVLAHSKYSGTSGAYRDIFASGLISEQERYALQMRALRDDARYRERMASLASFKKSRPTT